MAAFTASLSSSVSAWESFWSSSVVPGIILSRPFRREVHGLVHEKWDRVQGARSTVPKSDWSIYVCSGSLIPRGKSQEHIDAVYLSSVQTYQSHKCGLTFPSSEGVFLFLLTRHFLLHKWIQAQNSNIENTLRGQLDHNLQRLFCSDDISLSVSLIDVTAHNEIKEQVKVSSYIVTERKTGAGTNRHEDCSWLKSTCKYLHECT